MRIQLAFCGLIACALACADRGSSPDRVCAEDDCACRASLESSCSPAQAAEDADAGAEPPSAADPCAQDHGGCAPEATCSVQEGAAVCGPCPQGYTGSGEGPDGCADIDECAQGTHACTAPRVCMNEPGSFRCAVCPDGTREQDGACIETWTQRITTQGDDHARGVATDASDHVLVAGSTTGRFGKAKNAGGQDAFVLKYDEAGVELYAVVFGTASDDIVTDLVVDPDGNAYVFGSTDGRFEGNDRAGGFDLFIAKLNPAGELQWIRQFGSSDDDNSAGADFGAGALYLSGFTEGDLGGPSAGSSDAFVAKYSPSGQRAFLVQFGTEESDIGTAAGVDLTGNVFVAGETQGVLDGERNLGSADAFLVKYSATGEPQWQRELGTITSDYATSVATVEASNAYVVGITGAALVPDQDAGQDDAFLVKYDGTGTTHWSRQFGSLRADSASAVAVDTFGGAWITGAARAALDPDEADNAGLYLIKYDSAGTLKWSHQRGEIGTAVATDLAIDSQGRAYVIGFSPDTIDGTPVAGPSDSFLLQFDDKGERQ